MTKDAKAGVGRNGTGRKRGTTYRMLMYYWVCHVLSVSLSGIVDKSGCQEKKLLARDIYVQTRDTFIR